MYNKYNKNTKIFGIERTTFLLISVVVVLGVITLYFNHQMMTPEELSNRKKIDDTTPSGMIHKQSVKLAIKRAELNGSPEIGWVTWFDIAIDGVPIGRVLMGLYAQTPITSNNFRTLCTGERGEGFSFKGSNFHRIIPNFIVQGGDLHLPSEKRKLLRFDDEQSALQLKHDQRYLLQMANSGPNTNGSQFCFTLKASPHLNGKHAVFGRVLNGFGVVDRMELAGTKDKEGRGIPTEDVVVVDCGEVKI